MIASHADGIGPTARDGNRVLASGIDKIVAGAENDRIVPCASRYRVIATQSQDRVEAISCVDLPVPATRRGFSNQIIAAARTNKSRAGSSEKGEIAIT